MKTIQNNFKCILLLVVVFISISSCKKEKAPESEQEKFEKAMLAAGFKLVSEADIPKGITPYKLSTKEIQTFLNNPKAREDSLKQISYRNNLELLNNQKLFNSNNKLSATIMDEEEDPSSFESKTFFGSKQIYYFNTVSVNVSLTFAKQKATGGGWKWVESNHTITASKISNESDNSRNYYNAGTYTISFDGTSCTYSQEGNLYYTGYGQTYQKSCPVSASGGSNGTYLTVTAS